MSVCVCSFLLLFFPLFFSARARVCLVELLFTIQWEMFLFFHSPNTHTHTPLLRNVHILGGSKPPHDTLGIYHAAIVCGSYYKMNRTVKSKLEVSLHVHMCEDWDYLINVEQMKGRNHMCKWNIHVVYTPRQSIFTFTTRNHTFQYTIRGTFIPCSPLLGPSPSPPCPSAFPQR